LGLAVLAIGLCAASGAHAAVLQAETVRIARAIDGDSLLLEDGRQVRLIGVDAPEFKDAHRNLRNAREFGLDPAAYGSYAGKAAGYARRLAAGREARLEFDDANRSTGHKDRYGRLLAYVYVPVSDVSGRASELFLNAEMIRSGHAFTTEGFSFSQREAFLRLQAQARESGRGLWQSGRPRAAALAER
jgi:micrococcal nuclease